MSMFHTQQQYLRHPAATKTKLSKAIEEYAVLLYTETYCIAVLLYTDGKELK